MTGDDDHLVAHVKQDDQGEWAEPHHLIDHLENTAALARGFAANFRSEDWAFALGLIHDTGKSTAKWQEYIRLKSGFGCDAHLEGKVGKLDHSSPGSKLAEEIFGAAIGRILAYCVAGHHGGLPDYFPSDVHGPSALQCRLSKTSTAEIAQKLLEFARAGQPKSLPFKFTDGLGTSLWVRMLFSCLVDADFLDTECYMDEGKSSQRSGFDNLESLCIRFKQYMQAKTLNADKTRVNEIRQIILADCLKASGEPKGIFTLTVPTGGGKTLSSLAFALEHAKKHKLERIIYVIPYTSIIEQNAEVFGEALGKGNVVEHHSSLDDDDSTTRMRLAAENWDAPVIVTTTVQFYESLFAAKPSRCRKLHNIANSVVILDEAQLMPPDYMTPILETMQLLADNYSVSFVISTATQPALESRNSGQVKFKGLAAGSVKEIIADVPRLYEDLKRVDVKLPEQFGKSVTWAEVAFECSQFDQVLCIVSDRKSCRDLYKLMPEGTIHLSALMCGQHRSDTIARIKEKLKNKETVRVVSTQLVEAGVDIDFPVVFRAMAGLDSIAQAAGRCNREGRLAMGKVVVFVAEKKAPPGLLRKAAETTCSILYGCQNEPLSRENFNSFFKELYWKLNSLDSKDIIKLLNPDRATFGMQFKTAAENFKIIDDAMQRTVLVRYKKGNDYVDRLKSFGPDRSLLRKLQRYSVNIYTNDFNALLKRRSLEEIQPGIFALTTEMEYSEEFGLMVEENSINPEAFVL